MARPSNPEVRSRLISAGLKIIHARGFNGSGVQEITAAAGIPKGSFYNYFPTKDAFVVDLLEEYWSALEKSYAPILYDRRAKPFDRICSFFQALSREHEQHQFALGCLIGSLALELSASSPEVRAKLASLLARWAQPLVDCLEEAQASGMLAASTNVQELASVLIEAWEGAALRGKVLQSPEPYRRFETFLLKQLLK